MRAADAAVWLIRPHRTLASGTARERWTSRTPRNAICPPPSRLNGRWTVKPTRRESLGRLVRGCSLFAATAVPVPAVLPASNNRRSISAGACVFVFCSRRWTRRTALWGTRRFTMSIWFLGMMQPPHPARDLRTARSCSGKQADLMMTVLRRPAKS